MDIRHTLRRSAALLAGMMLLAGVPGQAHAEEPTTAPATEAATAEATEEATTEPATAPSEETEEEAEPEWFKAEITQYDDSLSLISYETAPESEGKPKEKKKQKKTEADVDPTPVELITTGGYVGEIPWVQNEPYIDPQPGQFAIVTYGWGHGVGMSQNGANFYADYSGWNYQDILFHYYPGTYLMNTGLAEDEEITIAGVSGDVLTQVSKIVFNEVGSSMNYEAIKAQAVAVYTYCKYNGNDSSDLRGKADPPQNVIDACAEVLGEALYFEDDYALTMFSASSGGITANCYEVFWADIPYLRSVSSDYDAALDPHYGSVTYFSDDQIRNMLEKCYNIKLSDDPGNWIQPNYSDETGYVTLVNIDDQLIVRGYEFKLAMGFKSSKFNVYYTYRPAPAAPAEEPEAPEENSQEEPTEAPAQEEAPEETPAETEEDTAGAE